MPQAILTFGPPGSGKGTQAERLEDKLNAVHFDTGAWIEKVVHDPANAADPVIRRQRERYESGQLAEPSWVRDIVMQVIRRIAAEGKGVILSGSPRTVEEAEGVIPLLEELYGKQLISVFLLIVKPETSIFRNTHRRICEKCGTPLIWSEETKDLKTCPICGGRLITRVDDNEEDIKVRLERYRQETMPVIDFIRSRGIAVHEIDGEPSPKEVETDIAKALGIS